MSKNYNDPNALTIGYKRTQMMGHGYAFMHPSSSSRIVGYATKRDAVRHAAKAAKKYLCRVCIYSPAGVVVTVVGDLPSRAEGSSSHITLKEARLEAEAGLGPAHTRYRLRGAALVCWKKFGGWLLVCQDGYIVTSENKEFYAGYTLQVVLKPGENKKHRSAKRFVTTDELAELCHDFRAPNISS